MITVHTITQSANLLAVDTGRTLNEKCCFSKIHFCGSFIKCDCYTLNLLKLSVVHSYMYECGQNCSSIELITQGPATYLSKVTTVYNDLDLTQVGNPE